MIIYKMQTLHTSGFQYKGRYIYVNDLSYHIQRGMLWQIAQLDSNEQALHCTASFLQNFEFTIYVGTLHCRQSPFYMIIYIFAIFKGIF